MATKPHHDADNSVQPVKQQDGRIVVYPRALNIVWGGDPRYWRIPQETTGPADLVQVSWLEVTGSYDLPDDKSYEIGFKVSLTQEAFGWSGNKVYVMAKVGRKGRYTWKRASLEGIETGKEIQIPVDSDKLIIKADSTEKKIFFGLYEVWSGKWKGGLRIHEAYIKAKALD